jgi:cobalt/nickel transport system permease protein
MLTIDKLAYCSRLKGENPAEKLVFALITIIICLSSNSITVSAAVFLLMSAVTVLGGGIPLRIYFKLMLVPFLFLLTGIITIAFEVAKNDAGFIWGISVFGLNFGVSVQSLAKAAKIFFKAIGAVSCLYFLSLNTAMVDIISVLRRVKLPEIVLELMELIYRFIFVLMETADRIFTSQSSRLGYSKMSAGYNSLGQLISVLFLRSYKYSGDLYMALESRCYNGSLKVLRKECAVSKTNILCIALVDTCLAAAAVIIGGKF